VVGVLWIVAGIRLATGLARLSDLARAVPLPDSELPRLTIIATARNEQARIETAARSFVAQDYPRCEVLIVDDRSTDATGSILDRLAREASSLRVIHVKELPSGWVGKSHALARAARSTESEWILFTDADVYKGFKKMRKKLGKKVLSGSMTVDEARAKLGRQFAQKGAEEPQEAVPEVQKSAAIADRHVIQPLTVDPSAFTATFEAAVTKAIAPLAAELTSTKDLLAKQQEDFTTRLAEQQKVIDAIADQPDPSTAAFSGLAFQPQVIKSRRPAAVPDQAEYAARAQQMVRRNLQHTYQTHSDPHVREAASTALASLGVGPEASMT